VKRVRTIKIRRKSQPTAGEQGSIIEVITEKSGGVLNL
jgi:hypothetical protein